MRINRLREQIEVFNKFDGKMYRVMSVSNGAGMAYRILDDGTVNLDETSVMINESNCLAFRIVKDPMPYPVPEGYEVKDGILMKNGSAVCEQGKYEVESILACVPGKLVLSVKGKDSSEIVTYSTDRDRFEPLCSGIYNPQIITRGVRDNDVFILSYHEEEVTDDDGSIHKKFVSSTIVRYDQKRPIKVYKVNNPITADNAFVAYAGDEALATIFIPSDAEIDADGYVKERDRIWLMVEEEICNIYLNGDIQARWSPKYSCFVISNSSTVYIDDPEEGWDDGDYEKNYIIKSKAAAAVVRNYPVLIDITRKGMDCTFTFCNERYELKKITSTKTRDRGYVYTIE